MPCDLDAHSRHATDLFAALARSFALLGHGGQDPAIFGSHRSCREPRRHGRSRDGHRGGHESRSVTSRAVEEPATEERANGSAEAAACLDHAEDGSEMWTREDIGRNRRELCDAHAEADPGHRIDEEEGQQHPRRLVGKSADQQRDESGGKHHQRDGAMAAELQCKLVAQNALAQQNRLLGAGAQGSQPNLSGSSNGQPQERVEDVRVVDRAADALCALAARYPGTKTERADFQTVLDEPNLVAQFDGVVIALPNASHENATSCALRRGLHVLCEKPFALSRVACLRLRDEARAAARVLAVSMVRRLLPSIEAARQAIARGLIGELLSLDFEDGQPYAWMSDSGEFFRKENGGVLADMGVHYLDLAREFAAGTLIPSKYTDDYAGGVEANAVLELQSETGRTIRIALSRTRRLRNTLIFHGTRGDLSVAKGVDASCEWRPSGEEAGITLSPVRPFANGDWPNTLTSCFAQQLHEFREAIRRGTDPRVGAEEAAGAATIVEWAYGQRRMFAQSEPRLAGNRQMLGSGLACVTGGTGFIGSYVKWSAASAVARVRASVPSPVSVLAFPPLDR